MTENDPSAPDPARPSADAPEGTEGHETPEAAPGGWTGSPYPDVSAKADSSEPVAAQQYAPRVDYTTPGAEPTYHAVTGADPSYRTPNPWSAPGAQQPQTPPPGQQQSPQNPYAQPGAGPAPSYGPLGQTSVYSVPPQSKPPRSGGKLLAGVAVVALLVGGIAGGTVGYLTSGTNGPSSNALDAPPPAQQTGNAPAGSIESVAQKLSPSVVELEVSGQSGAGEGSGFVLSTDGYIMTNNHVVEVASNGGQIQAVFQDGRKSPAKVVGRDPTTDIAVVKVDGVAGLSPVELGRSDDLRVGQSVIAIGSPFELAGTVTSGIVSSLHRPVRAGGEEGSQTTVMDAVQTDAAINPGNSGGPLANMSGQVIGINSAIYSPQSAGGQGGGGQQGGNVGIGFAIPIDQARRTANDIIKTGQAVQTYIGAKVQDAPNGGAQLGDITPGSPADKAGLKSGDVVTKIDDRIIDNADTLIAAVRTRAPDEKVKFTLNGTKVVDVTLGGEPVQVN